MFKADDKVRVKPGACKHVAGGYDVPLFLQDQVGTVTNSDHYATLVRFPQFANENRLYLHTAGNTDLTACSRYILTKDLMPAEPNNYRVNDRLFQDVDEAIAYATNLKTTTQIEALYA